MLALCPQGLGVRRNILKNSDISRRARSVIFCLLAHITLWGLVAADAGAISDRQFDAALLQSVFPGAQAFSKSEGSPPAVAAFSGGEIVGYVFSSRQSVQSTGYAAKPLDMVVGMTVDGIITGAVVAEHHEPLLVIGIHDDALTDFVTQYVGMDIRRPFRVAPEGRAEDGDVDAVSGATLSSMVINNAILKSARAVAASRSLLGTLGTKLDFDTYEPVSWQGLVDEASVRALRISVADAITVVQAKGGDLFAPGVPQPADDKTYVDLYAALATPARIGRNLFGEKRHNQAAAELDAGDQLIFVAAKGLYSFKGHRYRRRGHFDRLQLVQGTNTFRFALKDHQRIEGLAPEDAPEMREIGLFSVSGDKGFDPSKPWRLQFLVSAAAAGANANAFALFELPYELPSRYLKTSIEPPAWDDRPLWIDNWVRRSGEISVLVAALIILSGILIFQDAVAKRHRLYQIVRTAFLVFTVVWIGWIAEAQLSVINVLTFGDALMHNFQWDFFLLEPLIFILWGYVALARKSVV